MAETVRIRSGTLLRRGNVFLTVDYLYDDFDGTKVKADDVAFGRLPNKKIIARDFENNEVSVTGILTDKKPSDMDPSINLANSVFVFIGEDVIDLLRDKDLVAMRFGNCVKIIEYAKGLKVFEEIPEKRIEIIKAVYTSHHRNLEFKAQWMSQDFETVSGRRGG